MMTCPEIRTLFFGIRCLKKLNEKLGTQLTSTDIKLMFYLHIKGEQLPSRLCTLAQWNRVKNKFLPKLVKYGYVVFIETPKRKVRITSDGSLVLRKYNTMLAKSRMDKFDKTPDKKNKRDKYW